MAHTRALFGVLGSVLVHAGLLWWVMGMTGPVAPAPASEPIEIEVAYLPPVSTGPLAPNAGPRSGDEEMVAPAPRRSPAPETGAEQPPSRPEPRPRASRARPSPAPKAAEPEPAPTSEPASTPALTPAPAPTPSADKTPAGASPLGASERLAAHGRGGARRGDRGTGADDYASYGAEIVRIVKSEIDRDPVAGIFAHDSVALVLKVLPDGRLARIGLGRNDFVRVVGTSVGPLRTRRLLRRVLRASRRFPGHPKGFGRRHYEVGFTVNFTRNRG